MTKPQGRPRRPACCPPFTLAGILVMLVSGLVPAMADDSPDTRLPEMSLEELGRIPVTSVSRAPEPLSDAPAAIYVITQEDIHRAGVSTLAEALRLAPNLLVTQYGSSNYVVAARGFGGRPDAQSFSNKLLLLIDGRSVYSPLFSGIYLDTQDVLARDINRIEVISGPGATLWGANAVNGVVNVITQPAWLTEGPSVTAAAGTLQRELTAQYGGRTSRDSAYRIYAKAFQRDAMELPDGDSAEDGWHRGQAGFRIDFTLPQARATLQGDVYAGENDKVGPGAQSLSGANLLGRWEKQLQGASFHIQSYLDHVERGAPVDGARFTVDTFDLEAQHSLQWGARQQLVWGAGARVYHYDIANTASLQFDPAEHTLHIWNLFAQDTITLLPTLKLALGVKLEHNSYSGWEPQPDARLSWRAGSATMLWAAASRAVRAPTPFDTDVVEIVNDAVLLQGNPAFRSEDVIAYEAGVRSALSPALSLSTSVFFNKYDELRTVELSDTPDFLPLRWDNLMAGHAYGITTWATWQVTGSWRLSPGFTLLRKRLHQKQGASGILGVGQSGNDPQGHALLNSALDLGRNQTLDISLRHVGRLPDPALPAYTELSARFARRLSASWELSISGRNLLHERHLEYPAPAGVPIERSVLAEVRWRP
jgi:iron complex outermembrane receptor protein